MTTLSFTVLGRAAPQGSKKAVTLPSGKTVLLESSKRLKPYRIAVAHAAQEAASGLSNGLYDAPVQLTVTFYFQRPKGHEGTGRNAGLVKSSAPAWPTSRQVGDVEKLCRSVCDSLVMAAVIRDDSQVVTLAARKRYAGPGEPERTVVRVEGLAGSVMDAEHEAVAA